MNAANSIESSARNNINYIDAKPVKVAVDCIIFGFDETEIKLLLMKRAIDPGKGMWSLLGGMLLEDESADEAASRVLTKRAGLQGVYMEQLQVFSKVDRDPAERIISVAYYSLIDIHLYEQQISHDYHAEWFSLSNLPEVIFDHSEMVRLARERLRHKATFQPLVFELLPSRFTLPQLQSLYESIFDVQLDKRNFRRKLLASGLLRQQKEKEKANSRKGAYYYKLNKRKHELQYNLFLTFIPHT